MAIFPESLAAKTRKAVMSSAAVKPLDELKPTFSGQDALEILFDLFSEIVFAQNSDSQTRLHLGTSCNRLATNLSTT